MRTRRLIVVTPEGERELLFIGRLTSAARPSATSASPTPRSRGATRSSTRPGPMPRVTDLGSRNGILVNGRKVGAADLVPGDVVTVGDARIRFEERAAERARAGRGRTGRPTIARRSCRRDAAGAAPALPPAGAAPAAAAVAAPPRPPPAAGCGRAPPTSARSVRSREDRRSCRRVRRRAARRPAARRSCRLTASRIARRCCRHRRGAVGGGRRSTPAARARDAAAVPRPPRSVPRRRPPARPAAAAVPPSPRPCRRPPAARAAPAPAAPSAVGPRPAAR